jgi:hypothetical protein
MNNGITNALNDAYNTEIVATKIALVIGKHYGHLDGDDYENIKNVVDAFICEPSVIADILSEDFMVPREDIFKVA